MTDDVLLNKATNIERTLARVEEDYAGYERRLDDDVRRLDAIVLNLQRACQAAIDGAMHLVRRHRLGLPQESREAFTILAESGLLDQELTRRMVGMVGFRNIAIHDYQNLSLEILYSILEENLDDLRLFSAFLVSQATGDRGVEGVTADERE
jgi:uncharacterized protein YutE (UPF0331/DUF86 family)